MFVYNIQVLIKYATHVSFFWEKQLLTEKHSLFVKGMRIRISRLESYTIRGLVSSFMQIKHRIEFKIILAKFVLKLRCS